MAGPPTAKPWRFFNADGVPASGLYNPEKSEANAWAAQIGDWVRQVQDQVGANQQHLLGLIQELIIGDVDILLPTRIVVCGRDDNDANNLTCTALLEQTVTSYSIDTLYVVDAPPTLPTFGAPGAQTLEINGLGPGNIIGYQGGNIWGQGWQPPWRPGDWLVFAYNSGGNNFTLIYPRRTDRGVTAIPLIEVSPFDPVTLTAVAHLNFPITEYEPNRFYFFHVQQAMGNAPTLSIDGLTAREIWDQSGNPLDGGTVMIGTYLVLRYRAAPSPHFDVVSFSGGGFTQASQAAIDASLAAAAYTELLREV